MVKTTKIKVNEGFLSGNCGTEFNRDSYKSVRKPMLAWFVKKVSLLMVGK